MMARTVLLDPTSIIISLSLILPLALAGETILSTILTPAETKGVKPGQKLSRQSRSRYYDPYEPRYGAGRQDLERLVQYDRPRCGRCLDDRYDDRDDSRDDYFDKSNRDRYDDDRRGNHKPTYGNRYDRNQNYDRNDEDDKYNDRRPAEKKNGTDDSTDDNNKRPYDDKDERRPSGGRRGGRPRDRNNNRHDDRDKYRPDYYDRFLRDPERERERERDRDPYRERDYYDDPYRERRPLYERYPYAERYPSADRYDEGYGGGYYDYRRPVYDDRGNGYDDRGYGRGRGPHDSFRPWDETYRGQSGWDAGGRGYYFASGRPEVGATPTWGGGYNQYPREYARPEPTSSGWQDVNRPYYSNQGYSQGSASYPQTGYRQDYDSSRVGSGWQNVRPYRDQSSQVPKRSGYGQQNNAVSSSYGQNNNQDTFSSSSTTPGTSYLYQRDDEQITNKDDVTTKSPA